MLKLLVILVACGTCLGLDCLLHCQHGHCVLSMKRALTCQCNHGYTGHNCDRHVCEGDPCGNHGTCSVSASSFHCTCTDGYFGNHCRNGPCSNVDCGSHGICVETTVWPFFDCQCSDGYYGQYCKHSPCINDICGSHGRCVEVNHSPFYACRCLAGYYGDHCVQSPCTTVDCGSHSTCIEQNQSPFYNCQCTKGYSGDYCEHGPCTGVNCGTHGTCAEQNHSPFYNCRCGDGFSGSHCEHDPCTTVHCGSHGTCVERNHSPFYNCRCANGYSGENCEHGPCTNVNCGAHGTCNEQAQTPFYTCRCSFGYSGHHCEHGPCTNVNCGARGTCNEQAQSPFYTCRCSFGYSGHHCEQDACHGVTCSGQGVCSVQSLTPFYKCTCNHGFIGTHCETESHWSDWSPMTTCSVTCGSGFQSRQRACVGSPIGCVGSSRETTTCYMQPCKECPNLNKPTHGHVQIWSSSPGGVANYSCSHGYILQGPAQRYCLDTLDWSDTDPICVLAASTWTAWTVWSGIGVTCGTGSQTRLRVCYKPEPTAADCTGSNSETRSLSLPACPDTGCRSLIPPNEGAMNVLSTEVGGVAIFSCNQGYLLNGTSKLFCLQTLVWSDPEPTCVLAPGSWSDWSQWASSGETCGSETISRYRMCNKPNPQAVCEGSDSDFYTNPLAPCPACTVLLSPTNGLVTMTGLHIGATAIYTCNSGYAVTGSVDRYCLASNMWSGNEPTCSIACPTLADPAHGYVQVHANVAGSVATFSCISEYVLHGSTQRTCLLNGTWSGNDVTCSL